VAYCSPHRFGFNQESVVAEVRIDRNERLSGRNELRYLNLKSRWEEAIGIDRDNHNGHRD
jgi:hypothetical protein